MLSAAGEGAGKRDLLLAPINDESVGQIVGRHRHSYAIPREYTDMVSPHATRQLGSDDGSPLIDLDVVLASAKGILDDTLHLQ